MKHTCSHAALHCSLDVCSMWWRRLSLQPSYFGIPSPSYHPVLTYLKVGAGIALAIVLIRYSFFSTGIAAKTAPETVYRDAILCGSLGQRSFARQVLEQAVSSAIIAAYDR
jgi:hypothetical protein